MEEENRKIMEYAKFQNEREKERTQEKRKKEEQMSRVQDAVS